MDGIGLVDRLFRRKKRLIVSGRVDDFTIYLEKGKGIDYHITPDQEKVEEEVIRFILPYLPYTGPLDRKRIKIYVED